VFTGFSKLFPQKIFEKEGRKGGRKAVTTTFWDSNEVME
jgi:hypothetical protein